MKGYYRTVFEAQCALANKRNMAAWRIVRTENGWWTLEPKSRTNETMNKERQ